ncbi:MAG: hypothetical protein H6850_00900 [Alphaproteobacteria bacterium]|nr:MAG: hypothetical protein H6850_00900 [Alphaproteobacteria bacterium]
MFFIFSNSAPFLLVENSHRTPETAKFSLECTPSQELISEKLEPFSVVEPFVKIYLLRCKAKLKDSVDLSARFPCGEIALHILVYRNNRGCLESNKVLIDVLSKIGSPISGSNALESLTQWQAKLTSPHSHKGSSLTKSMDQLTAEEFSAHIQAKYAYPTDQLSKQEESSWLGFLGCLCPSFWQSTDHTKTQ